MRRILMIASLLGVLTASTAGASHPQIHQMETVQVIAHDLERATGHLYRAAEHDRHHYGYHERRALDDLYRLKRAARHFHRQVERYLQDPYHTEADYRSLVRTFHRARSGIPYLHARRHVRKDFYRVEQLMGDLSYYYEGYRYDDRRRYRGQRHGRHYPDYRYRYRYPHGKVRIYWPHFDIHWR